MKCNNVQPVELYNIVEIIQNGTRLAMKIKYYITSIIDDDTQLFVVYDHTDSFVHIVQYYIVIKDIAHILQVYRKD